jgi:purine-nucleoside phosphorylase
VLRIPLCTVAGASIAAFEPGCVALLLCGALARLHHMQEEYMAEIDAAVERLQAWCGSAPRVGLVLGSGLSAVLQNMAQSRRLAYADLPGMPVPQVAGHAGEVVWGTLGGEAVVALAGRCHYYEGHTMQRVVFGVRVLARWGVRVLVLTNAAGGVAPQLSPGALVLIRDHLNLTGDNPLRGVNQAALGPRFPDLSEVYSGRLRRCVQEAARTLGEDVQEGVYAGVAGPSYETPAEIRMLRGLGGDLVGMSTVAEAIAASHAGMEVLGVSVVTNHAAGLTDAPLNHQDVQALGLAASDRLFRLLDKSVANMAALQAG